MKFINIIRRNFSRAGSTAMMLGLAANALANPTGLTVSSGSASVSQSGSQLTITASQNAFLNWNTFNIAAGETTIFKQPSAASIVWNKVNDPNPSQIFGKLQANGIVVLLNSSGFYFGPNSFCERRRAGRLHGELCAAGKRRRTLGVSTDRRRWQASSTTATSRSATADRPFSSPTGLRIMERWWRRMERSDWPPDKPCC